MQVKQALEINVSADKLWTIVGTEFGEGEKWAVRLLKSRKSNELGSLGGRIINTIEYGPAKEILTHFDKDERELSFYIEADGLPPVIDEITQTWRVEAHGEQQSEIQFQANFKFADESMAEMLKQRMMEGLVPLLEQLKYFAEHDEPHPDKQAQLATK